MRCERYHFAANNCQGSTAKPTLVNVKWVQGYRMRLQVHWLYGAGRGSVSKGWVHDRRNAKLSLKKSIPVVAGEGIGEMTDLVDLTVFQQHFHNVEAPTDVAGF